MHLHDIESLTQRYLWWKTPDEVAAHPELLVEQIMNIGTCDDVVALEEAMSVEQLRQVLTHAEPGQFAPKSWQFWHLRLHMTDIDNFPPLPQRRLR